MVGAWFVGTGVCSGDVRERRRGRVTTALHPTTLPPLEPVVDALAVMAERYPVHGLVPGLVVADESGWTPASALLDDAGLTAFLDVARRRWPAAPHVAAALAWKCYAYWASVPAV